MDVQESEAENYLPAPMTLKGNLFRIKTFLIIQNVFKKFSRTWDARVTLSSDMDAEVLILQHDC